MNESPELTELPVDEPGRNPDASNISALLRESQPSGELQAEPAGGFSESVLDDQDFLKSAPPEEIARFLLAATRVDPEKAVRLFNVWRTKNNTPHLSLLNMDFQDTKLDGADFDNIDFTGSNFDNASLNSVEFKNVNLGHAHFKNATFRNATFYPTAKMEQAYFLNCDWTAIGFASFTGAQDIASSLLVHAVIINPIGMAQDLKDAFIKELGFAAPKTLPPSDTH